MAKIHDTSPNSVEMKQLEKRIKPVVEEAQSMIVETEDHAVLASEQIKKIKRVWKVIEEKRKEYTAPLNQTLKAINKDFKAMQSPLSEAEKVLKTKILDWEKTRVVEEPADEFEEALDNPNEIGYAKVRKQWVFRVYNKSEVPLDFLVVDEAKVREHMRLFAKGGAQAIPGIKFKQVKNLAV